jgi:hypothetical protein
MVRFATLMPSFKSSTRIRSAPQRRFSSASRPRSGDELLAEGRVLRKEFFPRADDVPEQPADEREGPRRGPACSCRRARRACRHGPNSTNQRPDHGPDLLGSGYLHPTGSRNGFIAKFDPDGQLLFADSFDGDYVVASDVAVDADGSLVVVGEFNGRIQIGNRIFSSDRRPLPRRSRRPPVVVMQAALPATLPRSSCIPTSLRQTCRTCSHRRTALGASRATFPAKSW